MDAAISNGFGIKRLKNLNTCSNLKRSLIIFLIVSAWCLKQGLSNDNTFSRFETGDTVPLNYASWVAQHVVTGNVPGSPLGTVQFFNLSNLLKSLEEYHPKCDASKVKSRAFRLSKNRLWIKSGPWRGPLMPRVCSSRPTFFLQEAQLLCKLPFNWFLYMVNLGICTKRISRCNFFLVAA